MVFKSKTVVSLIAMFSLFIIINAWGNTDELAQAILAGDFTLVKSLVEKGVDVNEYDSEFRPPLYYAVQTQRVDIIAYLIEKGADVNAPLVFGPGCGDDIGVIELALDYGNQEIIDMLLQAGVPEYTVDSYYVKKLYSYLGQDKIKEAEKLIIEEKAGLLNNVSTLLYYNTENAEVRALIKKYGPEEIADGSVNYVDKFIPGSFSLNDYSPFPSFPMATTFLEEKSNPLRYSPAKTFDNKLKTSWVEGVNGPGLGQKLAFFVDSDAVKISIVPGYADGEYFKKNNRLKKALLTFYTEQQFFSQMDMQYIYKETGYELELNFKDSPTFQNFIIDLPTNIKLESYEDHDRQIIAVLEIREVYKGTSWDDTCIAEIKVQ